MTEKEAEKGRGFASCFSGMPEKMQNMMRKMAGSCCGSTEMMNGKMPGCCSGRTEEESPAGKQDQDGPK